MMIFPPNNLPTASRSWARDVEKYISNLDSSFRSAEINNVSRDSQLTVTATSALTAATQAQQAVATAIAAQADADAAQDTAISANATAIEALQLAQSQQGEIDQAQFDAIAANATAGAAAAEAAAAAAAAGAAALAASDANAQAIAALQGLGSLDEATSTYKINASNVTVGVLNADLITSGSLSADRISGGVIDASNISGVNISGTSISGGTISGAQVTGGSISGAQVFTSNGAGLTADLVAGSVNLGAPGTTGSLAASSSFGMVLTSSNIVRVSAPSGIQGNSADFGSINAGNYTGTSNTSIAANTTGSFAGNVFINTSGVMFRSTTTSSREAKENIAPYEFDTESFISVSPVTFNYKLEAVSNPEEAEINQLGFVLEDFEGAGLGEHLVIPANEVDIYKGLRYDKLYMMLHKVVQEQNNTIKDLTARLEALESR